MISAKILIVEDEQIIACHIEQELQMLGYQVVGIASEGKKALAMIKEQRPDIVLMDIHIDGNIDGIEVATQIPEELHVAVVYLTAYSEEATIERARKTTPYGFIVKPFSPRELHATIQMALERRNAESLAIREASEAGRARRENAEGSPDGFVLSGLGSGRVALVTGAESFQRVVSDQLRRLGFDVRTANTLIAAADALASPTTIDLMVSDLALAEGNDAATLIREAASLRPRMGHICISGLEPRIEILEWLRVQNIDLLKRNFTRAELAAAVRNCLLL